MDKKHSKMWLIPLIIGASIFIAGIIMITTGISMFVPDMGDDGWYDAETNRDALIFLGLVITILGVAIGGIGTFASFASTPEFKERQLKRLQEHKQIFSSMMSKFGISIDNQETEQKSKATKVCEYCDTEVDTKEKVCPSCGAKKFKTKQ